MSRFLVKGRKALRGEIRVPGNKNAVLPIMAATLMVEGKTIIENVPQIKDVDVMGQILESLGAKVEKTEASRLTIDTSRVNNWRISPELARRIRGSVILAAPLLMRFKRVELPLPGGDSIGERALGTHFEMFSRFGVKIEHRDTSFLLSLGKTPSRTEIFLEEASVTATEMAIILASGLKTKTNIFDAACEPHVVDLVLFLKKGGAKINGEGTQRISISGGNRLRTIKHRVRPDHIEAGTYAIAAAITKGKVIIKDALWEDLQMISRYLEKMGVRQKFIDRKTWQILPSNLVAEQGRFHTRPWPGFPTDLMSSFIVLATQTEGTVLCHDWMYEWRIFFVDHLISMGANIVIADPHRVIVTGPTKLHGEQIPSPDIRAGGALLLAALVAKGESVIEHPEVIDRGYERIEEKLTKLGAEILRV